MQTSKYDANNRTLTGKLTLKRKIHGVLSSLLWLLASPILFFIFLRHEREYDKQPEVEEDIDVVELTRYNLSMVIPIAGFRRVLELRKSNVKFSKIPDKDKRFVLMNHLFWDTDITSPVGNSIDPDFVAPLSDYPQLNFIKEGFATDFASIPFVLQWLVGTPLGLYVRAAIVHDWAYANHYDGSHKGRHDCDKAMLFLMRQDKIEPWQRTLIYLGLRIGGGLSFYYAPKIQKNIVDQLNQPMFLEQFRRTKGYLLTYIAKQQEEMGILSPGTTDRLLANINEFTRRTHTNN